MQTAVSKEEIQEAIETVGLPFSPKLAMFIDALLLKPYRGQNFKTPLEAATYASQLLSTY